MKKLLPILMLVIGTGVGVSAGVYFRPDQTLDEAVVDPHTKTETKDYKTTDKATKEKTSSSGIEGKQYIKLKNQFVIPIVRDDRISSMVVMTLSVEVPDGKGQTVYDIEPKIRDVFLRVLFDFAAIGGFDGAFATNGNLDVVRNGLNEAAHQTFGTDLINDVMIFEVARQDY